MPQQRPLTVTGSAIADATGRAEVQLGQVPTGCSWRNVSIQVVNNGALFPTATVYKGIVDQASNQLDTTGPFGGLANTSATAWTIVAGEVLRVVFTGCTVGSTSKATAQLIQTWGS